ncbi:MAG: hypothetical protein ACI4WG_05815 [Erysipelotrichaceae bacterium]
METKNLKAYLLQVIYWLTNATVASFTIVYLARALDNDLLVGLMISLMGLFSLLLNTWIEKSLIVERQISLRKILLLIYGSALVCYLIYGYTSLPVYFRALLYCLGYSLFSYSHHLVNIYAAKISHNDKIADGNRPISLGPLYYSLMVLIIGYCFVRYSPLVYIHFTTLFVFISFLSVLFSKEDHQYCQKQIPDNSIKPNKRFILFIFASLLSSMAAVTSIKFISRIVIANGGNMFNLAVLFAIQSTVVIAVNVNSDRILKKISSEKLLLVSFIFSFIKVFLIWISQDLNLLYLAMFLSVFSYGALGFAGYNYLLKIVGPQAILRANKINQLCSSINAGSLFSGFICAYVMTLYNERVLLMVSCCCSLLAIVVFIAGFGCNKQ